MFEWFGSCGHEMSAGKAVKIHLDTAGIHEIRLADIIASAKHDSLLGRSHDNGPRITDVCDDRDELELGHIVFLELDLALDGVSDLFLIDHDFDMCPERIAMLGALDEIRFLTNLAVRPLDGIENRRALIAALAATKQGIEW